MVYVELCKCKYDLKCKYVFVRGRSLGCGRIVRATKLGAGALLSKLGTPAGKISFFLRPIKGGYKQKKRFRPESGEGGDRQCAPKLAPIKQTRLQVSLMQAK